MNEETHTPKEQPLHKDSSVNIEKSHQINETRNYSERIGDLNKAQSHYAKPFINEIIQPIPTDNGNNTSSPTKDTIE